MNHTLPYRVSYAAGRAKCQKCRQKIHRRALQIAIMVQVWMHRAQRRHFHFHSFEFGFHIFAWHWFIKMWLFVEWNRMVADGSANVINRPMHFDHRPHSFRMELLEPKPFVQFLARKNWNQFHFHSHLVEWWRLPVCDMVSSGMFLQDSFTVNRSRFWWICSAALRRSIGHQEWFRLGFCDLWDASTCTQEEHRL